MNQIGAINTGIMPGNPSRRRASASPTGNSTIIVTGVARSGTTMIASVLRACGVFMGDYMHDVVQEDAEALELIQSRNSLSLPGFIERRNAAHARWGFKLPNLHQFLPAGQLSLFRNPRLVVIYRDPVAVAVRNALSEHFEMQEALMNAINALHAQTRFVRDAPCPSMLLSYEKVVAFPKSALTTLLDFCEIPRASVNEARALAAIQPNRPEYLLQAKRDFDGNVDGIFEGYLCGWCREIGSSAPVMLELYADDTLLGVFAADRFRDDLLSQRIGTGHHGFAVDMRPYDLPDDTVVRIKVNRRTIEISGSCRTVRELSSLPVAA
ncbi:MAG: hypothetical protein AB7F35_29040 [Acetobacteraceae bacterium]